MERNLIKNKIKSRINDFYKGNVFIITDFLDVGNYDAVKNVLSKLSKEKFIIRVMRGIYKKPNYNEFLQYEIPASPDTVARALARMNNWTIGPKGDVALNILGISTQVPAVYHYISDGPYKKVEYGNVLIVFEKRTNKDLSGYSYKTILIIEAIKTLGPDHMDDVIRKKILSKCSENDLILLNNDGKKSRRWVYEEIKKILDMGEYNYVGISETL